MKKYKLPRLLIAAFATVLFISGCGTTGQNSGENAASGGTNGSSQEQIQIAYLVPSLNITYWQWVKSGVEQAAQKAGVKVVVMDSHDSASEQAANTKTALTTGAKGIVLSPVSSISAPSVLNPAEAQKVPVTFAAIGPDPSVENYASLVTSKDFSSGYEGGRYLAELVKKAGGSEIGVLSLPLDRTNAKQKLAGLQKAADEAGVKLVQIIQTKGLTVNESVTQATDLLTAHPDLKGIYGMYDNAGIGAVRVLKNQNRIGQVAIVSSDGSPETIGYIRDGSIAGIVVQQAVGQGIAATEQLLNAINGKSVDKVLELDQPLITKENIDTQLSQQILRQVYPESAGKY